MSHAASTPTTPALAAETRQRTGSFFVWHVLGWLAALLAVTFQDSGVLATLVATLYLTWFPGDALRAALRVRTDDVYLRALVGVAGSVILLLITTLVTSTILGGGGSVRALDTWPLFGTLSAAVLACLVSVAFSHETARPAVASPLECAAWAALAVVTQLTWVGAKVLDAGHGPWVSILGLVALGLLTTWCACSRSEAADRLRPAALFFLTLGIAWSFSMRGDYLYGFDLHQEYHWASVTLEQGTWQRVVGDPYAAMLSITALPAALVSLTGMDLFAYFKAWTPVMLALYTTGAFLFISRFAGRTASFLVTLLLFFIPAALWQLPAVSRQEVALLQFVVMMLLMFGAGGTGRGAKIFAGASAVALSVTHYTSAYVALAVVLGGFVLAWLWRLLRPGWRSAPSHLPVAVVAALLVGSMGWNVAYTQSSLNVGSAVDKSAEGGLREEATLIETFLNGATIAEVPSAEYFAETRLDAQTRSWLVPYSSGLQQAMIAEARPVELPEQYGPAAELAPVSEPSFVLVRQFANLLMALGVVLLVIRCVRRKTPEHGDDADLVALAVVALALTGFTRFNAELSQAYNPERLLLQTALFLGVGAAVLLGLAGRRLSGTTAMASRPRLRTAVPAVVTGLFAAALVFDATGLRAFTIIKDSGNLQRGGEYERRFGHPDADVAAATWLGERYASDDMVFADTYGALLPQAMSQYGTGVFGEISPYTLDQRAYVLATVENVEGRTARTTKRSVRSTFEFPRTFLSTYKSRIYSNGSAEVYR